MSCAIGNVVSFDGLIEYPCLFQSKPENNFDYASVFIESVGE